MSNTYLRRTWALVCLLVVMGPAAFAQTKQEPPKSLSLKAAIDYALANSETMKNINLDAQSAQAKIGEIRSLGLPQINANFQGSHAPHIQEFVLETGQSNPFAAGLPAGIPDGTPINFALSLQNQAQAFIQWNQLIFDGSYIIGLRATRTYTELANRNVKATEIQVIENVTKAYLLVLVNNERLKLLDLNLDRLDTSLREVKALNKQGFAENIDLSRLEVSRNNLKTERDKVMRSMNVAKLLLNFNMGIDVTTPLTLTDKLTNFKFDSNMPVAQSFDYENRIEYASLLTQQKLAKLNLDNINSGYLPKLYGSYTFGYNTAFSDFKYFGDFGKRYELAPGQFTRRWPQYSSIGLSLQIPIWDGFGKRFKAQQAKIDLQKIDNGKEQLRRSIDLQIEQANANLKNALETMDVQKRNMSLARDVVRVTRLKYQQGIGSNLEVVNAESSLKESETNYYTAMYDAIIARVDLDKALGRLGNGN